MNPEELRSQLAFYRDLGISELFRATAVPITQVMPKPPAISLPPLTLPSLTPGDDTLAKILADIGPDCRRCRLCEQRNKIVFGAGNEKAKLVFVGEAPGADEDAQGYRSSGGPDSSSRR